MAANVPFRPAQNEAKVVTSTKRIFLQNYPGAYNPSIIKYNQGYLLTFRYLPNRFFQPWISYIGIVMLDESFEQLSEPQLLDTRFIFKNTPSQSEDARIFTHNGKIYLIYNDNMDVTFPSIYERRDMYVVELICGDNRFFLCDPVKLYNEEKYNETLWQKNWSPFDWKGNLMLIYSINPHEIFAPNLENGNCLLHSETFTYKSMHWNLGTMRGGTPALLVDDEYLTFFHSGTVTTSPSSDNAELWHYFMGAYTFSSKPPFEITKITSKHIDHPSFYTYSNYDKRVIYPGGFVVDGSNLLVAYGKDDCEIWIATIDIKELKKSMAPVKAINVGEFSKH